MRDLREIAALVAEKVMEWESCADMTCEGCDAPVWRHESGDWTVWRPGTQESWRPYVWIADAWEMVEKMGEKGYDLELHSVSDGVVAKFREYERPTDDEPDGHAIVDPRDGGAPLAISLAALRALGVEVPEDA